MLEHPHKIPHAITVLMHDWEIHRQLMDVGFTYLNGMVALRKFRGNASRCIESLFLPENTDDSNEELQPYFLCRGNGAGTRSGCESIETVRDGGGYRGIQQWRCGAKVFKRQWITVVPVISSHNSDPGVSSSNAGTIQRQQRSRLLPISTILKTVRFWVPILHRR
mmetsp:Transcript_17196/g.21107  ORF Transcript_17196/g.21107 Transcript_17196/m.21107 type:complete len:165 (+) Transcript_17196:459-953(+)